ncbi:MAG: hypothetical protein D6690_14230 [Nitrospirae bacterium]|nr:MAG: hypothetical protein D6690_14230 [Nitrospirota bacterium]
MTADESQSLLAGINVFSHADPSVLQDLAVAMEQVRLPGGATLFREGDEGDELYIVVRGRLRAMKGCPGSSCLPPEQGMDAYLGEIGRGEVVGELALLTQERRSATVIAVRDTELLKLSREAFLQLIHTHPSLLERLMRMLAHRLRGQSRSLCARAPIANIALVPLTSSRLIAESLEALTKAIMELGSVLRVDSVTVDRQLGETGIAQIPIESAAHSALGGWLDDQEDRYRFMLYECDRTCTPWTQRCIRQADLIVLLASAHAPSERTALEAELFDPPRQTAIAPLELILVHPEGHRQPMNSDRWLSARQVSTLYHVRAHRSEEYRRTVRLLTVCASGLVLGGGGIRGVAHLGAIRALEEASIAIDAIAGTSMGAVIAGQYAMGLDHRTMFEMNRACWKDRWPMNDYTIPFVSCLAGRKLDERLQHMFGERRIEDLPYRYFCLSTDLTTGAARVHQRGEMWRYIRASCALPGILPPVFEEGHLLADGALVNNLPADIMKRICGGPVMVIDTSPSFEQKERRLPDEDTPRTIRLLWSKLYPLAPPCRWPSLFDILARAVTVGSLEKERWVKDHVDLYLHLPVDHFRINDYGAFERIVEVGYRWTQKKLAQWAREGPEKDDCSPLG